MPEIIPASVGACLSIRQSQRCRDRVLGDRWSDPRRGEGPSLFAEVDDQGYKQYLLESGLDIDQSGRGQYSSIGFVGDATCDGYTKWGEKDLEEMSRKPLSRYHEIRDGAPVGSLKPSAYIGILPTRASISESSFDPFASLPRGSRTQEEIEASAEMERQAERLVEIAKAVRAFCEDQVMKTWANFQPRDMNLSGWCGIASYQTLRLAEKEGLMLEVVRGCGHFFTRLPDGRILDATATQFNHLPDAPCGGYAAVHFDFPPRNPPFWHSPIEVIRSCAEWGNPLGNRYDWAMDKFLKSPEPVLAVLDDSAGRDCGEEDREKALSQNIRGEEDREKVKAVALQEDRILEIAHVVRTCFEGMMVPSSMAAGRVLSGAMSLIGFCGMASYQLVRLAEKEGLTLHAMHGEGHTFCFLPGCGCILDVTATQFEGRAEAPMNGYDPVYCAPPLENPPPWHCVQRTFRSIDEWRKFSPAFVASASRHDTLLDDAMAAEMTPEESERLDLPAFASLMANPVCRGPEQPWQPEKEAEVAENMLVADCQDAADAIAERLAGNCSAEWEKEASEWLSLYEPTLDWLTEAMAVIDRQVLAPVSDLDSYIRALDNCHRSNTAYKDSSKAAEAAGTINPDKENDDAPEIQAAPDPAGRAVPGSPDPDPAALLGKPDERQADLRQDPQAQDGGQAPALMASHPAFEPRIPDLIVPSEPAARGDQQDNRGDAMRQPKEPTYKSVPREEAAKVKTRVQMTSYFAGAYLSGNNDNFMCEAEGGQVLAALAPLKEVCARRFPKKKGSRRLRIQITEQRDGDSAYLKREKGETDAFNLSLHGIVADEASPLVEWLLRDCGIKRRREDEALKKNWVRFRDAGPVGTEGGLQKPEGGTPSQEAPTRPSDRAENRPNAVQVPPASVHKEIKASAKASTPAEGAPAPARAAALANSEIGDGYTKRISENTVQFPKVESLTRSQVLDICLRLREQGDGRLADRLANAGGKAKMDLAGEALVRLGV